MSKLLARFHRTCQTQICSPRASLSQRSTGLQQMIASPTAFFVQPCKRARTPSPSLAFSCEVTRRRFRVINSAAIAHGVSFKSKAFRGAEPYPFSAG